MIQDLGVIDYEEALKLQRELVAKRRLGEMSDSVLIAEHPAVFTIGRSGSKRNLLVSERFLAGKGIKVLDVDRGGDITFHGPGQIVIYPILDLKNRAKDLHRYLRDLEEVAIRFLNRYGVKGRRVEEATGVWVNEAKIASIGVAAKDWVTYHGLSMNISIDTKFFSMINPCGMKGVRITSLKDILGKDVPMQEVKDGLLNEFRKVFGIPEWLKKKYMINEAFFETKDAISSASVNTVCASARCPNVSECFSKRFATFMILGKNCTRACSFCSVSKVKADPVDKGEPRRIAECVKRLGLRYAIVTSVTRDDLDDGGSSQFVDTVKAIRDLCPDVIIELLIPDFAGDPDSVKAVVESGADIVGHNIETVNRLYSEVRSGAGYERSLSVLRTIKDFDPDRPTKSAILVGLGEREEEVISAMEDLKRSSCDILTIGQYLSPSKDHHPVKKVVALEEFERYKNIGYGMGFKSVSSGPFVRSSYRAEEEYKKIEENTYGKHYTAVAS